MWREDIDVGVLNTSHRICRNHVRVKDYSSGDNLEEFAESTIKLTKVDPG